MPQALTIDDSPLYFDVVEHSVNNPLLRNGSFDKYKILARRGDFPGTDVPLAIVGKGYKVIQNAELFPFIDHEVAEAVGPEHARRTVKDRIAYNGQVCIREVVFPDIICPINDRSTVGFRVVAINSFGKSAIRLYSGAIDFFCTNGMIHGAHDHYYARHTSGLRIEGIRKHINSALMTYARLTTDYKQWAEKHLSPDRADTFLKDARISNQLRGKLMQQFLYEADAHGYTVWAFYSALTYFATHSTGDFAVRRTDNDNEAYILHNREELVHRMVASDQWRETIAA